MRTPWGNSDELRVRRLRPGPSRTPDEVERNQRERLMAATVAATELHGYEAMRVEDIVEISGVSRSAFYRYFANKRECFLTAFDAILAMAAEAIVAAFDEEEPWDERLRAALDTFVGLVVDQPAAARLCLVEAYTAGPEALDRVDATVARVERLIKRALDESPERSGMPGDVIRAVVGGIQKTIHSRLARGDEAELPQLAHELLDWGLAYHAPPEPLRRPRVRPARPLPAPSAADDPVDRLLVATTAKAAEHGYQAMTVTEMVSAGRASLTTFYANFPTKEDAFLGALDRGRAVLVEAAREACEEAGDWRQGVRAGLDAVLGRLAAEPALARAIAVEAYAAGPRALDRRDHALSELADLLSARPDAPSDSSPLISEAIAGAVLALVYEQARRRHPDRMRELTPVATFVTLSPIVGGEGATAVATAA